MGDHFGSGINNSDPVRIKLFRFFSDYCGFEDKVGHISFTRNYAVPLGEYWRRQSAIEGRCNDSCRIETPAMRRVRFGRFTS